MRKPTLRIQASALMGISALLLVTCIGASSRVLAQGTPAETIPQDTPKLSKSNRLTQRYPAVASGEKILVRARYNKLDPLKIQGFLVDGKSVAIGQPFSDPSDWLRKTSVLIKNDSQKLTVSLVLQVDFIEYPGVAAECSVGKVPDNARFDRSGKILPLDPSAVALAIAPGATVEIPLSGCYNRFDPELKNTSDTAATVSVVQVEIKQSYFEDGTRHVNGMGSPRGFQKPSEDHQWLDVNPDEFEPPNSSHS